MTRALRHLVILTALLSVACSSTKGEVRSESEFVHVRDGRLVDADGEVALSAIRFEHRNATAGAPGLEAAHDESDFERVRALGFDSVHLALDLERFVEAEEPFALDEAALSLLDRDVDWAKAAGLRLVLALETPAGEAPEACPEHAEIWEPGATRTRVIAFFRGVAERYAGEPAIAGLQILASPTPTESELRFQSLAGEVIEAIRKVNDHHLIIVPEVVGRDCDYALTLEERFIASSDHNLAYGLAFDWPQDFTAQGTTDDGVDDAEDYPNDDRLVVDWSPDHITSHGWTSDSSPPKDQIDLKPGETSWTKKQFGYFPVAPELQIANVTLLSRDDEGTVCFDDVLVEVWRDEAYEVVFDLDLESHRGWSLWEDGAGNGTRPWIPGDGEMQTGADGSRGRASVCLSGTTSDASLGRDYLFVVEHGKPYRVTYYIRGENSEDSGLSLVKLDFYSYAPGFEYRNVDAMTRRLEEHTAYANAKGAPLYLYSVGTSLSSFDHGGAAWLRDALGWARKHGVSFALRSYRDENYGLFTNERGAGDPESVDNQQLSEVLDELLR